MSQELQVRQNTLTPKTMDEAIRLAEILASSDLVPKDFRGKAGNCLVAIQFGMELGMPPMQAIQNIMVINGRPAIWGDLALALVRNSGLLLAIKETADGKISASCIVQRVGEEPHTQTFTMAQAVSAKLAEKDLWKQYPERMLKMRARAFALRDVFTDVLKGLRIREEVEDYDPAIDIEQQRPALMEPRARAIEVSAQVPTDTKPVEPVIDIPMGEMPSDKTVNDAKEVFEGQEVKPKTISEGQRKRLYAIAKGAGMSDEDFKGFILGHGYKSSNDIPMAKYGEICADLEHPGGEAQT